MKKNLDKMTFEEVILEIKESGFSENNKIAGLLVKYYEEIPKNGLNNFKKFVQTLKSHPAMNDFSNYENMEAFLLIKKFIEMAEEEINSFEVINKAKDILKE